MNNTMKHKAVMPLQSHPTPPSFNSLQLEPTKDGSTHLSSSHFHATSLYSRTLESGSLLPLVPRSPVSRVFPHDSFCAYGEEKAKVPHIEHIFRAAAQVSGKHAPQATMQHNANSPLMHASTYTYRHKHKQASYMCISIHVCHQQIRGQGQ